MRSNEGMEQMCEHIIHKFHFKYKCTRYLPLITDGILTQIRNWVKLQIIAFRCFQEPFVNETNTRRGKK